MVGGLRGYDPWNGIQLTIITIQASCEKMNAGPRGPCDDSWRFTQRCARWSVGEGQYKSVTAGFHLVICNEPSKTAIMGRVIFIRLYLFLNSVSVLTSKLTYVIYF